MDVIECFYGLQFHNDQLVHEQVNAIASNNNSVISNFNTPLLLNH